MIYPHFLAVSLRAMARCLVVGLWIPVPCIGASVDECRARLEDFEARLGSYRVTFRYVSSPTPEKREHTELVARVWPQVVLDKRGLMGPAEVPRVREGPSVFEITLARDHVGSITVHEKTTDDVAVFSAGTWMRLTRAATGDLAWFEAGESMWLTRSPLLGSVYLLDGRLTRLLDDARRTGVISANPATLDGREFTLLEVKTNFPKMGTERSRFLRLWLDPGLSLAAVAAECGETFRNDPSRRVGERGKITQVVPPKGYERVEYRLAMKQHREVRTGVFLPQSVEISYCQSLFWPDPETPPDKWEYRRFVSEQVSIEVLEFELDYESEDSTLRPLRGTYVNPRWGGWGYFAGGLPPQTAEQALRLQYDGPDKAD